jgi:transposase
MSCATVISPIEVFPAGDVGRRREWTDEEKIRIVEESLRGFRQGSATARLYGVSRSLLSIWRRDYRRGVLGHSTVPAFMPVSLPAPEAAPCDVMAPAPSSADTKIEIVLLSGRRLMVPASIDPTMLGRLLSVLEGP